MRSLVTLAFVACQLSLFAWRPIEDPSAMGLADRANRTSDQLLRSVAAYCQWRAGESWRNVSISYHRKSQQRWDYLDAVRIVETIRRAPDELLLPRRLGPVSVPALTSPPRPELRYTAWSRRELVAELLRVNPTLTDAKILSHLSTNKLARMLADAIAADRRFA
jgi:hypothetical protein